MNAATVEYAWLGRTEDAIRTFEGALAAARSRSLVLLEGMCLLNLAEAHCEARRLGDAAAFVDRAAAVLGRLGEKRWLAAVEATRAKAHLYGSDWTRGREAATRAVALAIEAGDLHTAQIARRWLGWAFEGLGDDEAARREYEAAVAMIERFRREAVLEEMQISYLRTKLDVHEALIRVLYRLHAKDPSAGWDREALRASESSRYRSFLDQLPAPPGGEGPAAPLGAAEIQALLDEGTLLLEYFFGLEENVFLFAVAREGLAFLDLGSPTGLSDRASFLGGALRSGATGWEPTALRLRRELIEPALERFPGVRSLIVVPDGPLFGLPFEAILSAGTGEKPGAEPLVAYAPSASVLASLRRRVAAEGGPDRCDLLAVAVMRAAPTPGERAPARLPLARREAKEAARYFAPDRTVLIDDRATERTVRAAVAEGCRVAHFATHALVDPRDPGGSGLLLAPEEGGTGGAEAGDGVLTAREMAQMALPSDLVVLSGCGTGTGEIAPGEGVLGMSRAFLRAGARALLVTLWDVPDATAYEMTSLFYEEAAKGLPVAAALARARARSSPSHASAAFVLVGDGGLRLVGARRPPPRTGTILGVLLVVGGCALGISAALLALKRGTFS